MKLLSTFSCSVTSTCFCMDALNQDRCTELGSPRVSLLELEEQTWGEYSPLSASCSMDNITLTEFLVFVGQSCVLDYGNNIDHDCITFSTNRFSLLNEANNNTQHKLYSKFQLPEKYKMKTFPQKRKKIQNTNKHVMTRPRVKVVYF